MGAKLARNERLVVHTLAVAALISIPAIILFCLHYVHSEDPAYIWDYRGYWVQFQQYGEMIGRGDGLWYRELARAIRDNDYNPSAAIPLYPFFYWFGGGRESYIVALSLLYLLPAVVLSAAISLTATRECNWLSASMAFFAALTFMPFWGPTLRGMVDIVGLIPLGIATLIVLRSDFLQRRPLVAAIALGLMLWAPFLLRRWYAFSIVSFFACAFLFGLFVRWRRNERPVHATIRLGIMLGISGWVVLCCILLFQRGLAERALITSYSDIYSSYQTTFFHHFVRVQAAFGWYILSILFVGALSAFIERSIATLFCLACAVLTFLLFIRTQAMAAHHFLPVAFWLFPVYFYGLNTCVRWLSFLPGALRVLPFMAISAAIFVFGVSPVLVRSGILAAIFVPITDFHPLQLDSFNEYKILIADLQSNLKGDEKFVVWASSTRLSDELLVTLQADLAPRYLGAPHIAKRDFFRFDMLRAKYAVVATPPQTHQAPGSQQNITIPGELVVKGENYGSAFQKIGTYSLAGNTTGYLYRRTRPITEREVTDMINRLVAAYPAWRQKFPEKSIISTFTARNEVLGDTWGRTQLVDPVTIYIHPGETRPTILDLPITPTSDFRPSKIEFSMSEAIRDKCAQADGVVVNVDVDGKNIWSGELTLGSSSVVSIPPMGAPMSVTVDKKSNPVCDQVFAKFGF